MGIGAGGDVITPEKGGLWWVVGGKHSCCN